jgi:hypothetical protein
MPLLLRIAVLDKFNGEFLAESRCPRVSSHTLEAVIGRVNSGRVNFTGDTISECDVAIPHWYLRHYTEGYVEVRVAEDGRKDSLS